MSDELDQPMDLDAALRTIEALRAQLAVAERERQAAQDALTLTREETQASEDDRDWYRDKAIELDQTVFGLRALLQTGKGFSEIMAIEDLLEAFMSVCRERYNVRSAAVLLKDDLDPDEVTFRVRAYQNLPDEYHHNGRVEEFLLFRIPQDRGLLWQQVQQGDVFSVRDMRGQPRFRFAWEKWDLDVLQADIWCPVIKAGQVLGILALGECTDGTHIPESDFGFLQEIASISATNIDSTLKYEKNARILRNIQTLYDINQQLANVNDFKRLTIKALQTAVEAMGAQKANLMLMDKDSGRLEIKVVWGNIPVATREAINDGRMSTRTFAMGEGVAGAAAALGEPIRINDRDKIDQLGRNIAYCIMAVPLLYGGEVIGVMNMTNKVRRAGRDKMELDPLGRFTEDDVQLAVGLADQAAANLHKARLYDASITDRLTGLKNSRHFEDSLAEAVNLAVEQSQPVCLGVTDIDHFKRFNDTYGHQAGDRVLAEVAALLARAGRAGTDDMAFRYGGEEFCLLMPDTHVTDAGAILEAFRAEVEAAEFNYQGTALKVTVSIGLCEAPSEAKTPTSLFQAADKALYAAKEGGRNQVWAMFGRSVRRLSPEPAST